MFNKPLLPSRGLRVVSTAAFGIALAVLGAKAFSAQDKYNCACQMGSHFLTSGGTRTGRLSPSVRLMLC
jgi:hypothetical protein